MASPRSPGPYVAAAQDFNSGTLPFEDLVDIGLEPFISARPVPNASIDEQLVELASSGPGGRMMAALVLLATEPGLGSSATGASFADEKAPCGGPLSGDYRPMLAEEFRPMIVACRDQPWETVVRLDPDTMLGQAYLRQIMVLAALIHGNHNVASNLVSLGPPPARNLFSMLVPTPNDKDWNLTDQVLLELIANSWFVPNLPQFLEATCLASHESATHLIDLLSDAQETRPAIRTIFSSRHQQDALLHVLASHGQPRTLDHALRRMGRLDDPAPSLVPAATKARNPESVAMLRYLVDERGLDVSWIELAADPADAGNPHLDPRERGMAVPVEGAATALHGAAENGDVQAIKYLLGKGANTQRSDWKQNFPLATAKFAGQDRAFAILRAHLVKEDWASL